MPPPTLTSGISGMDHLAQNGMTEEQRQEAFKRAYLAELERYNEENDDNEEVKVEVDRQGWDVEMNGDPLDEEEMEDIDWEWCEDDNNDGDGVEITVRGIAKRLNELTDDDLQNMTKEEFLVSDDGPVVILLLLTCWLIWQITFCCDGVVDVLPHLCAKRRIVAIE